MTATEIARALGSAYRSGAWWRCRCPVHGSRGATLALKDADRGLIVKCWAGCAPREIFAELRRRRLIDESGSDAPPPDPEAEQRRREAEEAERQRRIALARDMWARALPAGGTAVERYLAARGIPGPMPPPSIRFIPMLTAYARHPRSGQRRPVMIAAVEHVEHGLVGVSRTWLQTDGAGKASLDPPRLFTGPVAGGAVRLSPASETLLVGEGTETTLAGMVASGLPGWAALSTSGLAALVLPPLVREVVILADHDANGAGERAAWKAVDRWLAEGRRVRIPMPPAPGTDFNDVVLGRAGARTSEARDDGA
jgi:putative DNA primase/helicase